MSFINYCVAVDNLLICNFQDNMRGKVLAEQIFRGKNMGIVNLSKTSYKTDFRLIHKHEEAKYLQKAEESIPCDVKIFPQTMEMPPLLKV